MNDDILIVVLMGFIFWLIFYTLCSLVLFEIIRFYAVKVERYIIGRRVWEEVIEI